MYIDFTTTEFKNGNIHIKPDSAFNDLQQAIVDLANTLDWLDTYLLPDVVMFGNDCGAYELYNVRTNNRFYLTDRMLEKLSCGGTVILHAIPVKNDNERAELYARI